MQSHVSAVEAQQHPVNDLINQYEHFQQHIAALHQTAFLMISEDKQPILGMMMPVSACIPNALHVAI